MLDDARKSGTVHVLGEPGQVATALLAWLHRQNLVAPAQVAPAVNKAVERLPMKTFTALDLGGRISVIDKLSQVSDYEKAVAARPKSGKVVTLFRYHKFRADDAAQQRLVLGGGLNKAEITQDWADKAVLGFLRTRQALLKQLAVATGEQRASLMQDFQANALSTPFIATTSDEGYARSLFAEYPPRATSARCCSSSRVPSSRRSTSRPSSARCRRASGTRSMPAGSNRVARRTPSKASSASPTRTSLSGRPARWASGSSMSSPACRHRHRRPANSP